MWYRREESHRHIPCRPRPEGEEQYETMLVQRVAQIKDLDTTLSSYVAQLRQFILRSGDSMIKAMTEAPMRKPLFKNDLRSLMPVESFARIGLSRTAAEASTLQREVLNLTLRAFKHISQPIAEAGEKLHRTEERTKAQKQELLRDLHASTKKSREMETSLRHQMLQLKQLVIRKEEILFQSDCAINTEKKKVLDAATYLLSMGANRSFIPAHETRSAIEVATTRGYILCMVALLDSPQTTITRTRHYKQVRRVDPESLEPPLAPEKRGSGFSQPHKKHSAKGSRKSEAPDDASYTSRGTLFSPCKPGFPDMQARDDSESADLPPQSSVAPTSTTSKSGNRCSGSLAIDAEFPPDFVVGTNNGVLPSLTTDDDNAPTSSGSKVKDEDLRSKDDDDCATKKTPRGMMIKSRAKKRSRREWELEAAARDCVIVDVYNVASRVEKPAPVEQICRANGEDIVSIAVKGRSWDAIKFLVDRRARCCLTPSDLEKARALTTDESLIRLLHAPLTTMV
eukprot:GEMP01034983.1.p1 GENE.GEMP01034983.1~~GEMP01034983.1.p1  ORF type:complete len:511 (+),score=124.90 GEMP01034983.1:91-1623(+)